MPDTPSSDPAGREGHLASSGGPPSDFLVQMDNRLPADFPPDERARLLRAEAHRLHRHSARRQTAPVISQSAMFRSGKPRFAHNSRGISDYR